MTWPPSPPSSPLSEIRWRVRTGAAVRHFSHGLVVQGRRPGILDLSVCMLTGAGSLGLLPLPSQRIQGADDSAQASSTLTRGRMGGLDLLGPLAAACTSEGIRRDTGIVSWLYWPNLVTIDGRLVATTSVSASSSSSSPSSSGSEQKEEQGGGGYRLVFKVSVNCFGGEPNRPSPLGTAATTALAPALPSTSIREELGVEIDMRLLRDKILHALTWYQAEWERGMYRKLVDRIQPTIPWLGRKVRVETTRSQDFLVGRAERLDDTGSLVLAGVERRWGGSSDHGPTETLSPGDVELVRVAD
jgi:hypothetical protein